MNFSWKTLPDSPQALWRQVEKLRKKYEKPEALPFPAQKIKFFKNVLRLKPYPYQAKFLLDRSPLKVTRWPRRAGKTTVMTGDDIHFAATNKRAVILAMMPKFTQTKEIYFQGEGGLHEHLARMDKKFYDYIIAEELQTIIRFRNRSRILAEVPEPFTIRGHGPKKISIDEMNFIRKDRDLWLSALLPMTLTRKVYINVASTPWNKDSIYWKMCYDKGFKFFSGNIHERDPPRYFLTWRDVLQPNGPLEPKQVEIMREQYAGETWRWKREMESSFVDDETAFLPSSLIIKCQNESLEFNPFERNVIGNFYVGWDLGRERDHGVVSVVDKKAEVLILIHCKQFPLGTPYVTQMAYIKSICDRWREVHAVYYDHTGTLGMDEEIKKGGFPGLKGVDFTLPNKHGMATFLKQKMMSVRESDKLLPPEEARRQFELPFDMDVQAELNCEQWEQRPGTEIYSFSHPQGSHDDRFWSIALACLASTGVDPSNLDVFKFG
ncbi:MAG: terminase family protein [Candidatus Bathyarchaeota archaeon]|nr:terminase family protein [Candidatus Bathyarchaeota archaeon]MDH5787583.1 terminase family protein [Candidatus Bathyarchaeota archaeon]